MKKWKDPLHVPSAKLVVEHNGKPMYMLNKALLDQQVCWGNLEKIKDTHKIKLKLFDAMEKSDNPEELEKLDKTITELEFRLQDLWKFERNANYHRFWERPKCKCPVLDNEDAYPHGYYVISGACPVHGGSIK